MHILRDEANEEQQNHSLAAAQSLVAVLVLTVVEVDVKLTQLVLYGAHDPAGSAHMSVPLLESEELVGKPSLAIGRGNQGLEGKCDQNRAGIRRPALRFLLGCLRVPVDDVPNLTGDCLAESGSLLIERKHAARPMTQATFRMIVAEPSTAIDADRVSRRMTYRPTSRR